jgi:hypothetical protein
MDNPSPLKVITTLTGLLMVGEAFALLMGSLGTVGDAGGWLSFKNGLLLQVDIVTGLALILIALAMKDFPRSPVFYTVVLVAVAAHVFRDWEYFNGGRNVFLANLGLFALNNVKLGGLLAAPLLAR